MPKAAFKLTDAYSSLYTETYELGYADITENGNILAGIVRSTSPIVNGSPKSLFVTSTSDVSCTCPVFKRGMENASFSLGVWALPTTFTGEVSILSHDSVYDGITFDGDSIKFKINFATTGSVEVKWPVPDIPEAYHIVATYSPKKIQLFINNELAEEIEISTEQLADGFLQETSSNLYSGQSVSGLESIVVDGFVIFNRILSKNEIADHFTRGRSVTTLSEIIAAFGGNYWDGVGRDIGLHQTWSTPSDWQMGLSTDVSYMSGILIPQDDPLTQLSKQGFWTGSFPLAVVQTNPSGGVRASWDGDGNYIVQASVPGIAYPGGMWPTLINGQLIPDTMGIDPTDVVIDIRIVFTGGIADDPAQIRDLTLIAYKNAVVQGSSMARQLTLFSDVSTALEAKEPIVRNAAAGLSFYGGSAQLTADSTEAPRDIAAIEFWVKPNSLLANMYIFDARATYAGYIKVPIADGVYAYVGHSAVYINGVLATSGTIPAILGEWTHILYIPTTPFNSDLIIGADSANNEPWLGQIGIVSVYPVALTAIQALALYNTYSGMSTAVLTDESTISVVEAADAYTNYAYNWSPLATSV